MSKKSKTTIVPSAPAFKGSSVNINGVSRAKTSKKNGTIVNEYIESDYEREMREQREKALADYLPKVNTFSPEYHKSVEKQLEAYQKQGSEALNDIYKPIIDNLKTDIASRFGSLNNSSFFDNLQNIESQRAKAVQSLVNDIQVRQNELEQMQLAKNYDYINMLYSMQNNHQNNINSLLAAANTAGNQKSNFVPSYQVPAPQNDNLFGSLSSRDIANIAALAGGVMGVPPEATAGAMAMFSDENLKKNIKPVENEEELLERLNAYKYEYDREKKADLPSGSQIGLMAQEVEKVLPEAVIDAPEGKQVDYTKVVALLVEGFKDLKESIDTKK